MASWNGPAENGPTTPPVIIALAAGAAWWLVGHLSWILTVTSRSEYFELLAGGRLAAVPLFAAGLGRLVLGSLIGGFCAGLVGGLAPGRPAAARAATLIGMAAIMTVTLAESFVAGEMADVEPTDVQVITALILASLVASMAGWTLGRVALRGRLALALTIAVLAAAIGTWIWRLAFEWISMLLQVLGQPFTVDKILTSWTWAVPEALALAAALVMIGARRSSRLAMWPAAVLTAWLVGCLIGFLTFVGLSLSYSSDLTEAIDEAWEEPFGVLVPPTEAVIAYSLSVVLALVVTLVLPRVTGRGGPAGPGRRAGGADASAHQITYQ